MPGISYAPQHLGGIELVNDLERPVFEKYIFLAVLKSWLLQQPEVSAALMSGSGSASFAILRDAASVDALEIRTRAEFGEGMWFCRTETAA